MAQAVNIPTLGTIGARIRFLRKKRGFKQEGLAAAIGSPGAARAVGQAVGANPVAWVIPCHRVLRAGGGLGGYRWGIDRKRAMLAWELSRASA